MAIIKFKSKVLAQAGLALPTQTTERALVINSTGDVVSSAVTSTELGHLSGVTSAIQTQINGKENSFTTLPIAKGGTNSGTALSDNRIMRSSGGAITEAPAITASRALVSDANGIPVAATTTTTELNHLSGVTSAVQTQLNAKASQAELDTAEQAITDLQTLSGVAANAVSLGTFTGTIIPDASTVKAALQALETEVESIPSPIFYAGVYNASTNTPDLNLAGARVQGALYRVSVAGTNNFGAFGGSITLAVGDKIVYNGTAWEKWDVNDSDIISDDVTEGSVNLFFTTERAQDAVGAALTDTQTVDLTYNDSLNTISASVITQQSLTSDSSGVRLVGDSATPGNDRYYGTNASGTKGFFSLPTGGSANDILETSMALANNQAVAANVTGFLIAAGVRGFRALVTVQVDATLDLFETFEIIGIRKASVIEIAQSAVGDESGVVFSMTTGGQLQYTSASYAGFVSGVIRFRVITLSG